MPVPDMTQVHQYVYGRKPVTEKNQDPSLFAGRSFPDKPPTIVKSKRRHISNILLTYGGPDGQTGIIKLCTA